MSRLLKIILFLDLISWVSSTVINYAANPINMVIFLVLNLAIWIGLWKGVTYVVARPWEDSSIKVNILRSVLVFPLSTFALQVGVSLSLFIRFFTDRYFFGVNAVLQWVTIILEISLFTAPILYLIVRSLKFKSPVIVTFIILVIWYCFMFVIPPMSIH